MPVFLISILQACGSVIAPIIATMGVKLMTERVVRNVTVLTLRYFEERLKAKHPTLSAAVDIVADALEVPKEVSK
jgi:hypothetical protein